MSRKIKKNVPDLRFKEFKEKLLNTIFKEVVLSNQYGPRFNANDYDVNGNIKTIRGTDISLNGEIKYSQVPIAKLDFDFIKNHILKDGDLVMITTADCGLTGVFRKQDFDYIPSAYAVQITLNKMGDSEYFKYFFQTNHAKNEVKSFIRKATVANLPCSDVLRIKLHLPNIQEQEKIASFLGAIDKRLTELRRKHELLQTYKRGVMQKIFSQEVRFKGAINSAFPDWEEKELKSIATVNPPSNYFPDQFLYIDLERVNNGLLSEPELINKEDAPSRAQRVLQKGDIFYQTVRPYQRNNLFFNLDGDYIASTGYAQLRAKENQQFLYQLIYSDSFVDKVVSRCTGTSYPAINSSDLANISIFFPTSIKEQEKIADFLTAIDRKIKAVAQQIDRTEQFKKGLLQKMFV